MALTELLDADADDHLMPELIDRLVSLLRTRGALMLVCPCLLLHSYVFQEPTIRTYDKMPDAIAARLAIARKCRYWC